MDPPPPLCQVALHVKVGPVWGTTIIAPYYHPDSEEQENTAAVIDHKADQSALISLSCSLLRSFEISSLK